MAMMLFHWMKTAILCLISLAMIVKILQAFALNADWTVSDALSMKTILPLTVLMLNMVMMKIGLILHYTARLSSI